LPGLGGLVLQGGIAAKQTSHVSTAPTE
jgi:hypothetical protein